MRRREVLALLGCAGAWPSIIRAEQPDRIVRVGVLFGFANDVEGQGFYRAFRQGLQELNWHEGRNLQVHVRWGAGDADRVRSYAMELVGLKPDVVLAGGIRALTALHRETRTIPIVFVATGDLAAQGIVASLARPAGNATGFTIFDYSLIGKLLETLKDIAPKVARVGLVFHPENIPAWTHFRTLESAAQSFGVTPVAVTVRDPPDIERAIGAFAAQATGGLILPPDVTTITHRQLIIGLADRYQLPAIYAYAFFVRGGGLISYGPDQVELYRRAAGYVARIYRGENPGDLPVQQPTKFELAINLRAAKALGISAPPTLLTRADEVIE